MVCKHLTHAHVDIHFHCMAALYGFRAAHQLWPESLYESQTVDTSKDMGDLARRLRRGQPASPQCWGPVYSCAG